MIAPQSLTFAEARARVLANVVPLPGMRIPTRDCTGRALLETVVAPHALPPFRNTAMDGFAVRAVDTAAASDAHPLALHVTDILAAGRANTRAIGPGEAARIMTGAMLPEDADAIVPFEEAEQSDATRCMLRRPARVGDHVRAAGADIAAGEVALERGRELSAYDMALLGSLGVSEVLASRAPRVAVFSTGDELLDVDAPLRPGAIRDSNLPMLSQLVTACGCEVTLSERLPDDAACVSTRVRAALAANDAVLTIGGVSAGDFDPVKQALESVGDVELWRVAMRPGRPQAFGAPGGHLFFGLPGNPGSVACVFEVLVRPALRALQGFAMLDRPRVPVRVARAVESRAGRTDFVRCSLAWRDGVLWAEAVGAQVSGHLVPQSRAHGLLVVPEAVERLDNADPATALVWRLPDQSA